MLHLTRNAGRPLLPDFGVLSDTTVYEVVRARATVAPAAIVLADPEQQALTYGQLAQEVDDVRRSLRALGCGKQSRVGVVLPPGPAMALAFLAISAASTCAPLNPHLGSEEYEAQMTSLRIDVLVLPAGQHVPATEAAQRLGIPTIALSPGQNEIAGSFTLTPLSSDRSALHGDDDPRWDDLALVMTTSGTTARPKVVPLTHSNLLASAKQTVQALALTPQDRCLTIAPLYHIQGLAVVLASLLSGGSVVCPASTDGRRFFSYLDACCPTWYVAGPATHRDILAVAKESAHQEIIQRRRLRFIRSGSAPLSPSTLEELERTFDAPVLEAYGLTEAGPLISSNPLPPRARKAGSVGVPAGPEVAIRGSREVWLPAGQVGEIVARGPNITSGYEDDEEANRDAFVDGWFRTGDLGYLDDAGYLFITGRLKELINRGGQKISPHEIEAVLLGHPDIEQAVAFALPHATLGEDVAAAVVMRPGRVTSPLELKRFAAARLARFKVPRTISVLSTLPLGPTGKVQRVGMAERLGLTSSDRLHAPVMSPSTSTERQLLGIWQEVLGLDDFGVTDDFYALGGDSLQAVRMLDLAGQARGRSLPPAVFFNEPQPTVQRLSRALDELGSVGPGQRAGVIPVTPGGTKTPFFYLTGDNSYYLALSHLLDAERPLYVLEPHDVGDLAEPLTIETMASDHIRAIQQICPTGPYLLGGYSTGGMVAYEMACRLQAAGHRVDLLVLIDVVARNAPLGALRGLDRLLQRMPRLQTDRWLRRRALTMRLARAIFVLVYAPRSEKREWIRLTGGRMLQATRPRTEATHTGTQFNAAEDRRRRTRRTAYSTALNAYVPGRYDGRVTLLRAEEGANRWIDPPTARWRHVASEVVVHNIAGTHYTCIRDHVGSLASRIQECLDSIETQ